MIELQANLYFKSGSSDKVYNVFLVRTGSTFDVEYEYGRAGTTLRRGKKNSSPMTFFQAQTLYTKVVNKELGKGYKYLPGSGAGPVASAKPAKSTPGESGFKCQLLNVIDNPFAFINDDEYALEEKHDGTRKMLHCLDGKLSASNKKGQIVSLPSYLGDIPTDEDFCIDGEDMGTHFIAFDMLLRGDMNMINNSFTRRRRQLERFFEDANLKECSFIKLTETASTRKQKLALYHKCFNANKEGVVFKKKSGLHNPGKPASGGDQFKYKFYATASFIVEGINEQRSVSIELLNDYKIPVDAGNVAIPSNHDIPNVGDVIEVRYLYAFKASGIIYQPLYLGKRSDVDKDECLVSQLKFQPEMQSQL